MNLPGWFRNLRKKEDDREATLEDAIGILGANRVCTAEEVYKARDESTLLKPTMLFLVSTLEMCAHQNKRKRADWRLVYAIGLSFNRLYYDRATAGHILRQPFIEREADEPWFNTTSPSGYWLVNFKPHFPDKTVDAQLEDVTNLGAQYLPLPEHVFAETLFSFWKAKKERLFEEKYHAGPNKVRLGRFRDGELIIIATDLPQSTKDIIRKDIGVCYHIDPARQVPA